MSRIDGRTANELRPVHFESGYVIHPEGSVLVSMGKTKVLCNVSVENGVPSWMKSQNVSGGWVTAEYAMLPRSTHSRTKREAAASGSRAQEIRRLVGRALRAAVDLKLLGERTLTVDCDVIQADGGTRTASITGGYVALVLALKKLIAEGALPAKAIKGNVAAISVGLLKGEALLDLCYEEDSAADADANFVMDSSGKLIEVQGTAEKDPFSVEQFQQLLALAQRGIKQLIELQDRALKQP